jgi:hypothetical protein
MALSAVLAASVLVVPGIIAVATGQLLLFPSLGPTAVMQAHTPEHPGARPTHIIVGHLVGLSSAYLMVGLLGLSAAPSIFAVHTVSAQRALAAVLSILLATFLELAFRTSHPPAAATTLLVALGSFRPTLRDVASIIVGVLVVVVVGEAVRRLRLLLNARLQLADWTPPR